MLSGEVAREGCERGSGRGRGDAQCGYWLRKTVLGRQCTALHSAAVEARQGKGKAEDGALVAK